MRQLVVVFGYFTSELAGAPALYVDDRKIERRFGDWNTVCWGVNGKMGRFPKAIQLASRLDAPLFWLMGEAKYGDGRFEGDWMFAEVLRRLSHVRKDFPGKLAYLPRTVSECRAWLRRVSTVHNRGKDTMISLEESIPMLNEHAGKRELLVYVVTSFNHAPRVRRDISALSQGRVIVTGGTSRPARYTLDPNIDFAVIDAETPYGSGRIDDVVVQDLPIGRLTQWVP